MALIYVDNLSIGYKDKVVLENLSFSINKGDYLCIIGDNGSGKSTLFKTLLGIRHKISGSYSFCDGLKANEIGYLPQRTQVQGDFPASVLEIVEQGFVGQHKFIPFLSKKEKEKALYYLSLMDILDLKNKSFKKLSGGQQQRVLLARALCASSRILFLDEPVTGLDVKSRELLYSIIEKLNKELNIAIVMISHNIEDALKYASHILYAKKNFFYGTTLEFKEKYDYH